MSEENAPAAAAASNGTGKLRFSDLLPQKTYRIELKASDGSATGIVFELAPYDKETQRGYKRILQENLGRNRQPDLDSAGNYAFDRLFRSVEGVDPEEFKGFNNQLEFFRQTQLIEDETGKRVSMRTHQMLIDMVMNAYFTAAVPSADEAKK